MHILQVREELSPFWPTLACELPQNIICPVAPPPVMDVHDSFSTVNSFNVISYYCFVNHFKSCMQD